MCSLDFELANIHPNNSQVIEIVPFSANSVLQNCIHLESPDHSRDGHVSLGYFSLTPPGELENYYLPGELEARIEAFVAHYNHLRYHESIDNLTPADVYFGRGQTILLERERIKRKTIQHRRLLHKTHAA